MSFFKELDMKIKLIIGGVLGVLVLILSGGLAEVNTNGYYKVKQSVFGDVSIINETGPFYQGWGDIFTYTNTNTKEFEVQNIRFYDGSVALKISGSVQVKMPTNTDYQLKVHKDYRGYDNVMERLVEKLIYSSMKQSATLMKAEQFYSSKREEFRSLTENQVKNGIYETYTEDKAGLDDEVKTKIKYNKEGRIVISSPSLLPNYQIEVNQLLIDNVEFDTVTEQLIGKRKEAEKAKQDRITAEEQGKAKVASAEADKLVEKIQAVTDAKKAFEVAEYAKKEEREKAEALLITGRAEAEASRLKVIAGLSPLEKAEIDAKMRIGIAEHMSKFQMPQVVVIGGNGSSGQVNPFDAMGLKAIKDLINDGK